MIIMALLNAASPAKRVFCIQLLLIIATLSIPSLLASPLNLELTRDINSNVVQLHCVNATGVRLSTRATFYLNNTALNSDVYPSFRATVSESDMVVFLIKPELEGRYTCGTGDQRSNAVLLIGKMIILSGVDSIGVNIELHVVVFQ